MASSGCIQQEEALGWALLEVALEGILQELGYMIYRTCNKAWTSASIMSTLYLLGTVRDKSTFIPSKRDGSTEGATRRHNMNSTQDHHKVL